MTFFIKLYHLFSALGKLRTVHDFPQNYVGLILLSKLESNSFRKYFIISLFKHV